MWCIAETSTTSSCRPGTGWCEGWVGRIRPPERPCHRLVRPAAGGCSDQAGHDGVERGYLLIPVWLAQMGGGDYGAGHTTAAQAAEIGERFGDADLVWIARDEQARALVHLGRVEEGLRLVDEALVAAAAGELSPIVTGIVYCNTIAFCRDVYELRHVTEWTDARRVPGARREWTTLVISSGTIHCCTDTGCTRL